MVLFSQVIAAEVDSMLDFSVRRGSSAAIVVSREIETRVIVRLLTGFLPPLEGVLSVNDIQPYLLNDKELSDFRKGIGVIYDDGGFISNLNVWENLTLQISYEGIVRKSEIEERGRKVLEVVGYDGSLSVLPNRLSMFERRQIAFARALLKEPLLMVYQSTLDGLSRSEQKHLSSLAQSYHEQDAGRTSMYITSNQDSLRGIQADLIYNAGGATPS